MSCKAKYDLVVMGLVAILRCPTVRDEYTEGELTQKAMDRGLSRAKADQAVKEARDWVKAEG